MKSPRSGLVRAGRGAAAVGVLVLTSLGLGAAMPAYAADPITNAADLFSWQIAQDLAKVPYYYTSSAAAGDATSAASKAARAAAVPAARAAPVYADPASVAAADVPAAKAAAAAKWRLPGSAFKPAVKTVGGIATALTGYSFGAMIGNGIVSFLGINAAGTVCTQDGSGFLAVLSGVDCSGALSTSPAFVPNQDSTRAAGYFKSVGGQGTTRSYSMQVATSSNQQSVDITTTMLYLNPANAADAWAHAVQPTNGLRVYCYAASGAVTDSGTSGSYGGDVGNVVVTHADCGVGGQVYGVGSGGPGTGPDTIADSFPAPPYWWYLDPAVGTGYPLWLNPAVTPTAPPATTTDPSRTLVCEIVGSDGATYRQESAAFTEASGKVAAPSCPALPAGVTPANVKLNETTAGGATSTVYDSPVDPGALGHLSAYPECSDGSCLLDLHDSSGQSCFKKGASCDGWFSAPVDAAHPLLYSCWYGTHNVPIDHCNVYRDVFDPAKRAAGLGYVDPVTGERTGTLTGAPGGVPSSDCFANGYSTVANPVEWVLVPVKCALQWAFVPSQAAAATVGASLTDQWKNTAPAKLTATVAGWDFGLAGNAGCSGIPIDLTMLSPAFHWQLLNACDPPLRDVAAWVNAALSVGIVITAAIAMSRLVGGIFGYGGTNSSGGDS